MAKTIFAALDTCVLISFVTQGTKGHEPEYWEELQSLVKSSRVTLLVPETVRLEYQKHWRELSEEIGKHVDALRVEIKKTVTDKPLWTEIRDIGEALLAHLESLRKEKLDGIEKRHEAVLGLLTAEAAKQLPHDLETWFRAKRRILAGRFVKPINQGTNKTKESPEADCCIIESIAKYFEGEMPAGAQFLFCSGNLRDFGVEVEKGKGKYTLNPIMKDGLPPTELFTDLASLVSFVRDRREVHEPPPELVAKAIQREAMEAKAMGGPKAPVLTVEGGNLRGFGSSPYRQAVWHFRGLAVVYLDAGMRFANSVASGADWDNSSLANLHTVCQSLAEKYERFKSEFGGWIGKNMYDVEIDKKVAEITRHVYDLENAYKTIETGPEAGQWQRSELDSFANFALERLRELADLVSELDEAAIQQFK